MPTVNIREYCSKYMLDDSASAIATVERQIVNGEVFAQRIDKEWRIPLTEAGKPKGRHEHGERYIYFFNQFDGEAIKLGATSSLYSRFQQVQVGSPLHLGIAAVYKFSCKTGTSALESLCRDNLRPHHIRGEWFWNRFDIRQVMEETFNQYPYARSKLLSEHFFNDATVFDMGDILATIRAL